MTIKHFPRLAKAIEAGSAITLFHTLGNWNPKELRALLIEVDRYGRRLDKHIDVVWKELAIKPEVFLSPKRCANLDKARDEVKLLLLETLAEIASVAHAYLDQYN